MPTPLKKLTHSNMKTLLNKKAVLFSLIVSALFISYVSAQSVFDIKFPVAELGNCANKEECKAYCEKEENFSACRAFASKYGLKGGDAENEDKFNVIKEDGGPGNCAADAVNPIEACHSYCNVSANMKECVSYAKKHNLMEGEELEEAEKVLAALERGAKLPAGCENKESCQQICEAPANISIARECFAFAEEAGLLSPGVSREQAEKVFKAIEEGRAPFKSPKDFEQCDNPPSDEILQKCIDFAIENGFLSGEEAEMVRKTGGRGPGCCRGREQCETYCQTHQDECFAFAEEHDLISPEDRTRMEEGMSKFKEGINNAPPEIRACLEQNIGSDTLNQILSDQKRPTKELGEKMRTCFESQFGGGRGGPEGREFGDQFPPEIKACLESKIGAEGVKRLMESGPNPEMESAMKGCFEMNRGPQGQSEQWEGNRPIEGSYGSESEIRQRIFREQFEKEQNYQFQNFQNRPGEFPQGMSEEEMRRIMEERMRQMQQNATGEYFNQFEGGSSGNYQMPPEGYRPSEGMQYPPQGGYPPLGSFSPEGYNYQNSGPSESFAPPASYNPSGGGSYESYEDSTLPPPEPLPTSLLPKIKGGSLLANIISIVSAFLQR